MTTEQVNLSLSQLSLHSAGSTSEVEDWDRSMNLQSGPEALDSHTPRNSVAFPADVGVEGGGEDTPGRGRGAGAKRTLSELLKLHAEKGTDVTFSQEEASRIAEVLGQWINSGPSPYESEDDFFTRTHAQDDSSLAKRSPSSTGFDLMSRPRGQSESVVNAQS
ncbi:hypothetical protein AcV5_000392 [Taiwanofungus camphoratus]|nr:hypothetical protein AcV5_000392 [Antrodia cinnamomea]